MLCIVIIHYNTLGFNRKNSQTPIMQIYIFTGILKVNNNNIIVPMFKTTFRQKCWILFWATIPQIQSWTCTSIKSFILCIYLAIVKLTTLGTFYSANTSPLAFALQDDKDNCFLLLQYRYVTCKAQSRQEFFLNLNTFQF